MKNPSLQLMIHGKEIGNAKAYTINYPGVEVKKINTVENKNYVFLDLNIAPSVKPGKFNIDISSTTGNQKISYELKQRRSGKSSSFAKGVNSKDFIYLIMPDRFSNGDESNDKVAGMRDQSLRRDTVFNRHGGDLKGIQNHLGYLDSLGVTAIWLNPVWENDMPNRTEHGYAFTNHYKVDPRLGGNESYRQLIDAAHARGLKVIQDAVYNHVGSFHHTITDMPMKDWVHQWDEYTNTSYKDQTLFDPYASQKDRKVMSDGWFVPQMPDLNQNNPFVANFLIQHALWSVEEFGIDGWRIDTYAYNDLEFMNRCNKALTDEYPKITLFGETWVQGVPNQSYFCENNYNIPYKSNLQGVTDFQALWGITDAMTKDFGWNDGVNKLYTTLAQDFVYKNPTRNVIFLDNHDISRFYSVIGEDVNKYLTSLSWLMTCRGIPHLYYSAEFATPGVTSPNDGYVRLDFPGGWKNDIVNKFNASGRSEKDKKIFDHLSTLANYRKTSSALTNGKFMQYLPEDGLYVYFRYDNKQTVMVVLNTSKSEKTVNINKFSERTKGFSKYFDISKNTSGDLKDFTVGSFQSVVYELRR
ncbi:MAG: alpha-amylase [Ferruginibacter sp.]|nr:alpha-amylase [Ferruginibacter sp.]